MPMADEPDANQLKREADRISRNDSRSAPRGIDLVPRDETVQAQPADLYKAPAYLKKTATPELVAELNGILRALWEINEQHQGQKTMEVEVFYMVTGEYRTLAERARAWCRAYFEQRADPSRLSPQVGNDPFELYLKLIDEYDTIFGNLARRDGSLNYVFLNLSSFYSRWFLYDRLWKGLLDLQEDGSVLLKYRPAKPKTPALMAAHIESEGWLRDDLTDFLSEVRSRVDPERMEDLGGEGDESLLRLLAGMAADIQEMRPFLLKGFNPQKTVISPGAGLVVAWTWTVRLGIANLVVGETEAEVVGNLESRKSAMAVSVDHDGLLFGYTKPWVTARDTPPSAGVRPLALNCYVLGLFHERLYSFYDRIDFERIRARARGVAAEVPADDDVALALSCQDLAQRDEDEGPSVLTPRRRPIRSVRLQRLLSLLSGRFGCEVRQGHGSEITVYRRGGKKWILGCHKRDAHVPSEVVANLLKRVGIGLDEWLDVVYS